MEILQRLVEVEGYPWGIAHVASAAPVPHVRLHRPDRGFDLSRNAPVQFGITETPEGGVGVPRLGSVRHRRIAPARGLRGRGMVVH